MDNKFTTKKVLGAGGCGKTFLIDYNGQNAVLKLPHQDREDLKKEAERMKMLHNRYCVHIINVIEYEGKTGIIMEYCPHKSLKDVLEKLKRENKKLSKKGILKLFCEMVLGLKYLHGHKILHLDLKPGDFGLSEEVEDLEILVKGSAGTPIYNAPEKYEIGSYCAASDIYSLGLILYEMCTLERFCSVAKNVAELKKMQHEDHPVYKSDMNKIPSYIPAGLKKLIKLCLKFDPDDRPTIEDIYEETIIRNYINDGIKQFLFEYDSDFIKILKKKWKELLEIGENDESHQIRNKKEVIIYLLSFYTTYYSYKMSENEIMNMWQLIRCISREIGFQLLLDPYSRDKKVKYYKTEEYEQKRNCWGRSSFISDIFPKLLEYLYLHGYKVEAEAIVSVLTKESIDIKIKNDLIRVGEKLHIV